MTFGNQKALNRDPIIDLEYPYRSMLRIRCFEEMVLEKFSSGYFFGTTHTYLGQEANAVGVLQNIEEEDIVVSNHRCHGHFLAYGGDMRALFAELMGKSTGVSGGRGGSQHLHWKNFFSNGVLGGTVPIATGMGLAEKIQGRSTIAINFLGDGTMGEGVVYESFNMASLWSVPIFYVVENNHIAQTTPVEKNLAGEISSRLSAFGIKTTELDSSDLLDIHSAAWQIITEIRANSVPQALVINTHRFGPHSKGDDTRDEDDLKAIKNSRDPLKILAKRIDIGQAEEIKNEVNAEVLHAFQTAVNDPHPDSAI
jgi:TPP-dependent pyruvate/acetoin dehydrogenase alpha subunit